MYFRTLACVLLAGASITARQAPSSPPPSHLEAVAYDGARNSLVVHGGSRQSGGAWADSGDMWEWDGDRWRITPQVPDGPGPRRAHALGYDPSQKRIVLVGGVRTRGGVDEPLDGTWLYDGGRWTRGPEAPVMFGHQLVFDSRAGSMLLLGLSGGEGPGGRQLIVWRWAAGAWRAVDGAGPILGGAARAAFDARRSVLVVPMWDGLSSRMAEWDGREWTSLVAPGPSRRTRHAVAYDHASSRVVLFGGRSEPSRDLLGDGWSWDGERWTPWSGRPEVSGPRASASLASDAASRRLFLFGGLVPQRGVVADLWIRASAAWTIAATR